MGGFFFFRIFPGGLHLLLESALDEDLVGLRLLPSVGRRLRVGVELLQHAPRKELAETDVELHGKLWLGLT